MTAPKWTEEKLIADAKRFETSKEWYRESKGAYQAAIKLGLFNACCAHMENGRFLLTDEDLKRDAMHYRTRDEWKYYRRFEYGEALKRGLLDACCSHMIKFDAAAMEILRRELEPLGMHISYNARLGYFVTDSERELRKMAEANTRTLAAEILHCVKIEISKNKDV